MLWRRQVAIEQEVAHVCEGGAPAEFGDRIAAVEANARSAIDECDARGAAAALIATCATRHVSLLHIWGPLSLNDQMLSAGAISGAVSVRLCGKLIVDNVMHHSNHSVHCLLNERTLFSNTDKRN